MTTLGHPPKSIYDRPSGRTANDPMATYVDKAGHLSSIRDPFKPRQSDWAYALVSPAAIFAYNWKRANLPLSALQNFCQLYMVTWLLFAVTSVPWVLRVGNNVLEKPADMGSVYRAWPWYAYIRYAFLFPYALQVMLAIKAWWIARSVTKLAILHCQDPTRPVSTEYDMDVRMFGFHEDQSGTLLDDLFTMRLQANELNLQEVLKPPSPEDVGGEEELEDGLFTAMPALMFAWYGPIRSMNLVTASMSSVIYVFLATLMGMLLGWPVELALQWSETGLFPKNLRALTDLYRASFMNAAWLLLYSGGMSLLLMGMIVLFYKTTKRTGVLLQLQNIFPFQGRK